MTVAHVPEPERQDDARDGEERAGGGAGAGRSRFTLHRGQGDASSSWEPPGGELYLHSEYYESDDVDAGLDGAWDDDEDDDVSKSIAVYLSTASPETDGGAPASTREELVRQVLDLLGSKREDAELVEWTDVADPDAEPPPAHSSSG